MKLSLPASLFILLFSSPLYAYIDPGSGSAIMSAIVGFFVAIAMAVKTYWYKIKSFFGTSKAPEEDDATSSTENQKNSDSD